MNICIFPLKWIQFISIFEYTVILEVEKFSNAVIK